VTAFEVARSRTSEPVVPRTEERRPVPTPAPPEPAHAEPVGHAAPPVSQAPAEPAPASADGLGAASEAPGRVRISWAAGPDGRTLRRRFLGRDGAARDAVAVDVRTLPQAAGEFVDDVPGPTGVYEWTIGEASRARIDVVVPVEIELLGPGEAGGARFSLRRTWRGAPATLAVEAVPGAPLFGIAPASADDAAGIVFESGYRLDAVRTRVETERAAVKVPRFRPDGRVERGPDGLPVTEERVIEREQRVFEADGIGPDGVRRTWSRKMTDG
jgi:hypothetical protein